MKEEPLPGAQLTFDNLLFMLNYLALPQCKGRISLLPQLDVLCFVQSHGMSVSFLMEIEEEWLVESR